MRLLNQGETVGAASSMGGDSRRQQDVMMQAVGPAIGTQLIEHAPELRRFARRLTGANDQADDLLQDCIERALSRADLFEPGTNLRAWLFTIMRNIAITRARRDVLRDRHARMTLAQSPKTEAPRQEAVIALKETLALLQTLPETDRAVVDAMCFDELGHDEAARRFDTAVGTVKSRLSRARQRLRAAADVPRASLQRRP
jgi:RNA polymerase sigma-70 factor (ECF subfamily)